MEDHCGGITEMVRKDKRKEAIAKREAEIRELLPYSPNPVIDAGILERQQAIRRMRGLPPLRGVKEFALWMLE
jgi:hypothetical protein